LRSKTKSNIFQRLYLFPHCSLLTRVKLAVTFANANNLAKIPPTQKRADMLKKTQKNILW